MVSLIGGCEAVASVICSRQAGTLDTMVLCSHPAAAFTQKMQRALVERLST